MQSLASRNGRLEIILAAERLFAMHGLHGVSLRQISDAAGQKNASAIQYHFGSRDRLVEAIFEHRMQSVNPRRAALLAEARDNQRLEDMRTLVSILVWPLAEELRPREEGNHYLQFLSRASHERLLAIELAPPALMTAWLETINLLRETIRYLPKDIAQLRLMLASEQSVYGLASFEATGAGANPNVHLRVETLIDIITAGISAPPSKKTLDCLAS